MMYMKGNEKRERESRKKAEKEALDKTRKEEEVRDAKRQARKLNFLITQTELYSHFVGNKIKSKMCWLPHDSSAQIYGFLQLAKQKSRRTLQQRRRSCLPRRVRLCWQRSLQAMRRRIKS